MAKPFTSFQLLILTLLQLQLSLEVQEQSFSTEVGYQTMHQLLMEVFLQLVAVIHGCLTEETTDGQEETPGASTSLSLTQPR